MISALAVNANKAGSSHATATFFNLNYPNLSLKICVLAGIRLIAVNSKLPEYAGILSYWREKLPSDEMLPSTK